MITRRLFSFGLLAAPAIIRTPGLLMPIPHLTRRQRNRELHVTLTINAVLFDEAAAQARLQAAMEKNLLETITSGPIPYNDAGLKIMEDAAHKAYADAEAPCLSSNTIADYSLFHTQSQSPNPGNTARLTQRHRGLVPGSIHSPSMNAPFRTSYRGPPNRPSLNAT
jgi:hypothetical protein